MNHLDCQNLTSQVSNTKSTRTVQSRRRLRVIGLLVLAVLLVGAFSPDGRLIQSNSLAQSSPPATSRTVHTYTHEGVSVEFSIEPIASHTSKPAGLLAGTEATVRLRIVDASEGKVVTNLRPAAWLDRREADQPTGASECREKVQAFLQSSFSKRPSLDLNNYFVLALNNEPNISVIDPLSGFGGSKLYMLVALPSPGEDWVLSADKKRLYVSMPQVNEVAVINTVTWKMIANIAAGVTPTRVALQRDGRYLWIGNNAADAANSGVTVLDTESLKIAAQFKTGAGHHEIAFAADDRLAFITNKESGTLSVVDVRTLTRLPDIKLGARPAAIVFSPLSDAVYITNEGDGAIVVVDGRTREIRARMQAEPGLGRVRLTPDSRFGFVVNPTTNRVYIFDVSSSKLIHSVPVGGAADQISFTSQFAYVRSTASEFITMLKLADLDKETKVAVTGFPAGQRIPKESPAHSYAEAIVPAPGNGTVLIANPADKAIYYYTEGMGAPMGSFQNYRRDPKAILVLDNGLVETMRGVYTATVRLPDAGLYDLTLLLDAPRLVNCFNFVVAENPDLPSRNQVAIKVEPLLVNEYPTVGENYNLRFKVLDSTTNLPKSDLADMGVLVYLAPGIWQHRTWAKAQGEGVYEMSFSPPKAGVYYVHFQCPSLGVGMSQITPLILQAVKR